MNDHFHNDHIAYCRILQARNMQGLRKNMPLWKLKLTEEEYELLKQTLINHSLELGKYGIEAALCYAEWWRREYKGNIPSKEDVAIGIGLSRDLSDKLYMTARNALLRNGYTFLHSLKGTEYFRTLLNQGGLPINYIKNSGNLGCFSRFLKELVSELSTINYDWNEIDSSIIRQFNCVSYLGKAFKNENIYDVSMQIAHAIIAEEKNLLPYDDTDESLAELTRSLETAYTRAKSKRKVRPLSLYWNLITMEDGTGALFVNMDVVKDISSSSIPGLNYSTCYSFDVFVAGTLVGKYVRKGWERDDESNVRGAIYTRITVGKCNDILWSGEPVVEVKVRCDNDDRIFLTITGCYSPNFEYPQVFQMLDDNLYRLGKTANAECNLAVFTPNWETAGIKPISICGQELYCRKFTKELEVNDNNSHERITLTNDFTPYTVEFSGNYISWVEKSNYKLLSKIPIVRVYDENKEKVSGCKVKYRFRNENQFEWHSLKSSCVFPCGVVDVRVEFPDGKSITETFYSVGDLRFDSDNEDVFSTDIICSCNHAMRPEMEIQDYIEVNKISNNCWRVSRNRNSNICPSVCNFRLYNTENPVLVISIAIPFDGVTITDVHGNIVPNGKVVSLDNLTHYCIVSHGGKGGNRRVNVSYVSDKENYSLHLSSKVIDGLVSLADYNDLIMRMFNLYGANSFNRSSSVKLNASGTEIFIRKFILESTIEDGMIRVIDNTEDNSDEFVYKGDVYAFPVGEELATEDFFVVKLERLSNFENLFSFPDSFSQQEVVVFSGLEARRRIVPKYYNRNEHDYDKKERAVRSCNNTHNWSEVLGCEDVMTGRHWRDVCKAFDICRLYRLPFTTYNGLKSIGRNPKLLAKFVIAMWLNDYREALEQDIDRFEQEMVVAIHWISAGIWEACINEFMGNVPAPLHSMMNEKISDLVALLQELFNATVSTDIASEFVAYLISGEIGKGRLFTISDIKGYCARIHGLFDDNNDLPTVVFSLSGNYYCVQDLRSSYKTMIESAMCAAEYTCNKNRCIDLFANENREIARTINFYRKYFKEIYSDIFFKTVKYITTQR